MSDTKKMIKTFGVLLGVLVIIFIVLFIFMSIAGSKVGNTQLVNVIENAAKRYYASHESELPSIDASAKITTDKLIADKYMKPFDKITANTNCKGEVTIYNNGGEYLYVPSVKCSEFKTSTIGEVLEEKVVTAGDGLYKNGNIYYYKGEYVDNYIKLGNNTYRIISMEDDKIKVVDTKLPDETFTWDNRYNVERGESGLGINDYSKSRLRESINNYYEKFEKDIKKYVIMSNWCMDKIDINDTNINKNNCENTISDYLGTITPFEYVRMSLDENCNSLYSGACKNYNYFNQMFSKNLWTMTAVSNNSYNAMYIASGMIEYRKTYSDYRTAIMFNINNSLIVNTGDGSLNNPYVIK